MKKLNELEAIAELEKLVSLADSAADAAEEISIRSEDARKQLDKAQRLVYLLQDSMHEYLNKVAQKDA